MQNFARAIEVTLILETWLDWQCAFDSIKLYQTGLVIRIADQWDDKAWRNLACLIASRVKVHIMAIL